MARLDGHRLESTEETGEAMSAHLLGPKEVMALTGWSSSEFYRRQANHELDFLKVHPSVGRRCYSKAKVERWVAGEALLHRSFGRKAS